MDELHEKEFEQLFEETQAMIFNLGMRLFRNREDDALDFAQDVYLQAYRNLHKFEGRSKASTWLYSLAMNLGLNRIKKEKRLKSVAQEPEFFEAELQAPDENQPDRAVENLLHQAELEKTMQRELQELPELYRLPLVLHYYEHMPYRDISEKLGMAEGTLKSYIYRAKVMLRDRLRKYDLAAEME